MDGLQNVDNQTNTLKGVLASAKHFMADGATTFGCNMGNSNVFNFRQFIEHNTPGYVGAVKANVGSVMVSYSAINWIPNSINSQYLLGLLREDLNFRGFTISDYNDLSLHSQLLMPRTFMNFTEEDQAFAAMVNGGVDMFMVSHKAMVERIHKHGKKMEERGFIPRNRLEESVARILSVKMAMGLVEKAKLN